MIERAILIVGAPRSGTSTLQKIIRGHPGVWSLPSESDMIWDRFCHPRLRGWKSEALDPQDCDPVTRDSIRGLFQQYMGPAGAWSRLERSGFLWGFKRTVWIRSLVRRAYAGLYPLARRLLWNPDVGMRFVEKTASNCFRLGFVNEVFPDARILHVIRDGRNSISSLIEAWRNPTRFFTYQVPVSLDIVGYPHNSRGWKFVLPPGWQDYVHRELPDVCAFQWRSCHQAVLDETGRDKYAGRVLRVRLEDLVADPVSKLKELCEFSELPFDDYFQGVAASLPVVNSEDGDTRPDKWKHRNLREVEQVLPDIRGVQQRLGYT